MGVEIEAERGRTSARALWGGKQVGTRGKSAEKVKRKTEREGKHACMSRMNRQMDGYKERQCDASALSCGFCSHSNDSSRFWYLVSKEIYEEKKKEKGAI